MGALNERLAAEGGGRARPYACTESCPSPCNLYYRDMPGVAYDRTYWQAIGPAWARIFQGLARTAPGSSTAACLTGSWASAAAWR